MSKQTIRALSREHGINEHALRKRLALGWPLDEALHAPLRKRKAYTYKRSSSKLTNEPLERDLDARAWVSLSASMGGLSIEEIAALAECSAANVREILRNAIRKFRRSTSGRLLAHE